MLDDRDMEGLVSAIMILIKVQVLNWSYSGVSYYDIDISAPKWSYGVNHPCCELNLKFRLFSSLPTGDKTHSYSPT